MQLKNALSFSGEKKCKIQAIKAITMLIHYFYNENMKCPADRQTNRFPIYRMTKHFRKCSKTSLILLLYSKINKKDF